MNSKNKTDRDSSVTISVTLSPEQAEYLAKLKQQQGVSASWLLRSLLARHMQPRTEGHHEQSKPDG